MFNLWKPLIPPGVEGTWAPVEGSRGRMAWYFNGNYPWLGMLICAPVIGLWYWCTDQYIVQRALGAPNEQTRPPRQHLRRLPQAVSRLPVHHSGHDLLRPGQERQGAGADAALFADGKPVQDEAQAAFPLMVKYLLPAGLRGIVVAGLLSALMGSLAGVFNACSTLFTVDLYEKWKPKATQHQIVRMGRIATAVMVLIALAWIPVIKARTACTNTCRRCRAIWRRRSSWCSSSACSSSGSTPRAASRRWWWASSWACSAWWWTRR